ncbi:Histone-lysine N-methyltransferase ATX1 [Platanthera guangdongensis]|uniref:Histone-lysine N-methyltransferase ATX1 n=1 Tax=Platanthera guangdongensis TaxID=2320717 RepID=A0ABR2N3R3_9ASPA
MKSGIHDLPPSKRFKLLHQKPHEVEDSPSSESRLPPEFLPAKKRLDSHHLCSQISLPAKKRVWVPHPLFHPQAEDEDEDEDSAPTAKKDIEEEDDGVLCTVCRSTDGDPADPIVFCDGCELMVHASCYGNPLIRSIPEGDWFCARCETKAEDENGDFDCCLCPKKGGAVKPNEASGRWAHILCALFVPEAFFRDPVGREGIDCSRLPERRWEVHCYLCGVDRGCAIECSQPKCGLGFHVSCGLEKELCIEYKETKGAGMVTSFCEEHTQLWKKQELTGRFKIVPRQNFENRRLT